MRIHPRGAIAFLGFVIALALAGHHPLGSAAVAFGYLAVEAAFLLGLVGWGTGSSRR